MSKELILIELSQKEKFGNKNVFSAEVYPAGSAPSDIQILSTNEIKGRPVVRVELLNGASAEDIDFMVEREVPVSVTSEIVAPGILEFILTTQDSVIFDQENEAWNERTAELAAKTAGRLKIKPAQEGKAWKKRNLEESLEDTPQPLTDIDREAADLDQVEDDPFLSLGEVNRYAFTAPLKSDVLQIELFSPFGNSEETQLQITRTFSYPRPGSDQLVPHSSADITTLAPGEIPNKNTPFTIEQGIFFQAEKFELTITVTDLKTRKQLSRVITSEEIGPAV
ncbi:hypothetical protein H3C70_04425, partial [Patescibacteria group bacterium]|nr:hypothetical protein [Patescibacteria group bacterium]